MRWMESGGRRVDVVGSMRSIPSQCCSGSLYFCFLFYSSSCVTVTAVSRESLNLVYLFECCGLSMRVLVQKVT